MTQQLDDQNKRAFQAIIICVLIVMMYTQFFLKPPPPSAPVTPAQQAAVNGASQAGVPLAAGQAVVAKHPTAEELAAAPKYIVNGGTYRVEIVSLGARISSFKLLPYKLHVGEDAALDLVDNPVGTPLPLGVYLGESDEHVLYNLVSEKPAANEFTLTSGTVQTLVFEGVTPKGLKLVKKISFKEGVNEFKVEFSTPDSPEKISPQLEWAHYYPQAQENARVKVSHFTYLNQEDKVAHTPLDSTFIGTQEVGMTKWISLSDLYFMSALIPEGKNTKTVVGQEGELLYARADTDSTPATWRVYLGPKDYRALEGSPDHLERSIDLGWFSFVAIPLLSAIHYLYLALGNYGLAIIALTIIVRTAMLPLSKASLSSAKKMQDLQPEIKALRERVKDSNQLNQEIFQLYKKRGVNPMGGCLPMLIQIPVFFGLYNALLNSIELRHAPYALWIKDLSSPEYLNVYGIGIPVLVLLMSATMIWQQRSMPQPADEAQAKAMKIMPYIIAATFIFFPMPAGLVLYWLVSNIISITQQEYLRKTDSSAYTATAGVSLLIFVVGYVVTLL